MPLLAYRASRFVPSFCEVSPSGFPLALECALMWSGSGNPEIGPTLAGAVQPRRGAQVSRCEGLAHSEFFTTQVGSSRLVSFFFQRFFRSFAATQPPGSGQRANEVPGSSPVREKTL